MNLLIVDDQISVLEGIVNGIDFSALGIDRVFTACDAAQAREIFQKQEVSILLSDIEMPGEDGLSLNRWTAGRFPSVIRILLTSHASFEYAQQSIKMGCFDYILQPAPLYEIEAVVRRAVEKLLTEQQNRTYYDLERMNAIVLNLFSSNPANRAESVSLLNEIGYLIREDSAVQAVINDVFPYIESGEARFSDSAIFPVLLDSAGDHLSAPGIYALACVNRYKQFVVLLFGSESLLKKLTSADFEAYYDTVCRQLTPEIASYVTPANHFSNLRDIIYLGHLLALNNVSRKAGLYFTGQSAPPQATAGLQENVARWTRLMENGQFEILEDNIFSYLDYNASLDHLNLENLSEFHQEISKLFFVYSYNHKIDIMSLFSGEYTYNDYMGSFKNVESLKKGIHYLKTAIAGVSAGDESGDVIRRATDYILSNLSLDLTVKDVAEHVSFSPEYFSKLFKKETGENVKNYILRVKVDAAKDMLKTPNIPISIIASELGYSNFSHFTQMFRKHESITPSEYRKKFLKGEDQE